MCWKVVICWMASRSFWNSKATLRGPCVRRCSRRSSALYASRHCLRSKLAKRLCRMSEILTYSSISNACRAMSPIVLTFGGDASPFVASSAISCVGVTSVSASRAERILPMRYEDACRLSSWKKGASMSTSPYTTLPLCRNRSAKHQGGEERERTTEQEVGFTYIVKAARPPSRGAAGQQPLLRSALWRGERTNDGTRGRLHLYR
uniref:Uncharacterized protein n=1 Tax=Arundo donax TaxID=35708 RepID=A0A0A9CM78_ARUDO